MTCLVRKLRNGVLLVGWGWGCCKSMHSCAGHEPSDFTVLVWWLLSKRKPTLQVAMALTLTLRMSTLTPFLGSISVLQF
jgi:hypothetical protein